MNNERKIELIKYHFIALQEVAESLYGDNGMRITLSFEGPGGTFAQWPDKYGVY